MSTGTVPLPMGEGDEPFYQSEAFWEQTGYLRRIREAARASLAAPWAVFGSVLARVSFSLPPHVVFPSFVGAGVGSLNMFVAVVGASGDGKGTAASVAKRLVPNTFGGVEAKPSSGESLAALYAEQASEENPTDPKHPVPYLRCARSRALIDVPEITWLGAVGNRMSDTTQGELASAFVGERLGGRTKNRANTITAPANGYRMALITGVQYGNANVLFDMATTGVPQRFVWVDTTDFHMPDEPASAPACIEPLIAPDALPADCGELQDLYRLGDESAMIGEMPYQVMRFPSEVYEHTRRLRFERNAAKLRGEDHGDNMEGHLNMVRIKVAALLAWLDFDRADHMHVTEQDWRIAGQIIEYSCSVRDKCEERYRQAQRADLARRELLRRGAQDDAEERRKVYEEATPGKVLDFLSKRQGQSFTGRKICQGISRNYRPFVNDALRDLAAMGKITCTDDQGQGKEGRSLWRLTPPPND